MSNEEKDLMEKIAEEFGGSLPEEVLKEFENAKGEE